MPPNEEQPPQGDEPNQVDSWLLEEAQGDLELLELLKRREELFKAPRDDVDEDEKVKDEMELLNREIQDRKAGPDKGKPSET